MSWAALDDGFHEDPRTVEAGLAAAGLYAFATTYCARHLTDGKITRKVLARLLDGGDMAPIDALLAVGLFRETGGAYEVVGYLDANPTREIVEERREKRRKRAEAGARAMHAHRQAQQAKRSQAHQERDIEF
jgi:hypothetical protein